MQEYIEITDEQIAFLQNYPYPWSFLGKRTCTLPEWMDSEKYGMLSLRVAKVCLPTLEHSNIPTLSFPLFLTSANLSGMPESKTLREAEELFL
jgi:tRNA A37 threonylcarbamoyladenosine synthetase subunit TsaC/SUA5/YrdC